MLERFAARDNHANRRITMENKEVLIGEGVGFERIRRITGYLVGTLDRFNNAKRAEEHDRVKHASCLTNTDRTPHTDRASRTECLQRTECGYPMPQKHTA